MSSDTLSLITNAKVGNQSQATDVNAVMVPRGIEVKTVKDNHSQDGENTATSNGNKSLHEVIAEVKDLVQNMRRNLSFSVEKETGKTVVKVIDAQTDEVIRQIPSEEFLKIAEALEKTKSLLSKTEA